MTSRERVDCILAHKKPDRVAIDIGSTASGLTNPVFRLVKDHFGVTSPDIVVRPDESAAYYNDELIERMGGDFKHVFLTPPDGFDFQIKADGSMKSEWGITKKSLAGLTQNADCPLSEAEGTEDIKNYPWPDPSDKGRVRGLRERAKYLWENTTYAIASRAVSHGFFELAWELRGMENFFVDMIADKEFANALLDKTLEIQLGLYDALLSEVGEYVQIVETADDYGSQRGPLMSPALFREMIAPRRKKLNDFIRSKAPNAKIFLHSCGSIVDLLDDLIETGVDVINPVQPLAVGMETFALQERFGDRVIFHGSIDEQSALIGSADDLRAEMARRIASLGKNGGYILAPTSNFQEDMPLENIVNFAKFAKELGVYGSDKEV